MSKVENNLQKYNLSLPDLAALKVAYKAYTISKNHIYISGQLPLGFGELSEHAGQLGNDCTVERGNKIAEFCALNVLAQLKEACQGDLDKVKQCVKITVFVNSSADFTGHPAVANGASEVFNKAFSEDAAPSHARSAIGTSQLPFGVAVEVEAIFEI